MDQKAGLVHPRITQTSTAKATGMKSIWRGLKRDRYLYLIAAPMLVYFLIFKYVPMWGILIAFKNYTPYVGFMNSPWVGLEHFERFFRDDDFLKLLRNTLAI